MIANPKMVYKVWRKDISDDRFGPSYEVATLVKICETADQVIDTLEFGKWMKITYEVDTRPDPTINGGK